MSRSRLDEKGESGVLKEEKTWICVQAKDVDGIKIHSVWLKSRMGQWDRLG